MSLLFISGRLAMLDKSEALDIGRIRDILIENLDIET